MPLKNVCPRGLSQEARRRWRLLSTEYGIADAGGRQLLETYCRAFDRCAEATRRIDADGMTVVDKFGQAKPHPLIPAERDARQSMLAALKALSLDIEPVRARPGRPAGS